MNCTEPSHIDIFKPAAWALPKAYNLGHRALAYPAADDSGRVGAIERIPSPPMIIPFIAGIYGLVVAVTAPRGRRVFVEAGHTYFSPIIYVLLVPSLICESLISLW